MGAFGGPGEGERLDSVRGVPAATVDRPQENGTTALHIAAENGHSEVVRQLLAEDPGLLALHAGDGPMRGALAHAMADVPADRFRMLGVRADVGSLMALATVVLHTSRKEGTPNALLEAQSLGCPVVATAGGGTVDAVEDGGSGALCAVDDVQALRARTGEILRDPALRARMSARAAVFVRERFGMARMVRETLEVCGIPHASPGGAL